MSTTRWRTGAGHSVVIIPRQLADTCSGNPERLAWVSQLPAAIDELCRRWSLTIGEPWEVEASCSWVAPAERADGTHAVLKLGMPHMEAAHELAGLRFWNGYPTVRVIEADAALNAMLLERCEPGTTLREVPEFEQDVVIAGLLRSLWRRPANRHSFRPLSKMLAHWADESLAAAPRWRDAGLVRSGLRLFDELSAPAADDVLLATDLHAGNVLRAERQPWLAIDPKPFVGDRAYDATQHLINCRQRLRADSRGTIGRFADLLQVDHERVRLWLFARAAAEPRDEWSGDSLALARVLE
jgi:streptomycin 6-kinase